MGLDVLKIIKIPMFVCLNSQLCSVMRFKKLKSAFDCIIFGFVKKYEVPITEKMITTRYTYFFNIKNFTCLVFL